MKLTINVTQEDIDNGRQLDCLMCPIALATCKAIAGTPWMLVGPYTRYLRLFDSNITIRTQEIDIEWPPHVVEWIRTYDKGRFTRPISFEVDTDNGVIVGWEVV